MLMMHLNKDALFIPLYVLTSRNIPICFTFQESHSLKYTEVRIKVLKNNSKLFHSVFPMHGTWSLDPKGKNKKSKNIWWGTQILMIKE